MVQIQNMTIFLAVFGFYLLDFSINAVTASCRALIVDCVPLSQQDYASIWASRLAGGGQVIGYLYVFLKFDFPKIFLYFSSTCKPFFLICFFSALDTLIFFCSLLLSHQGSQHCSELSSKSFALFQTLCLLPVLGLRASLFAKREGTQMEASIVPNGGIRHLLILLRLYGGCRNLYSRFAMCNFSLGLDGFPFYSMRMFLLIFLVFL
jgi:hypothetical protein